MQEIIEFLKGDAVNRVIALLLFIVGVIIRALVVSITWDNFTAKSGGRRKVKREQIDGEIESAISIYTKEKTKLEIKKLSRFAEALTYLLEVIPNLYGETKIYEVIEKQDVKIGGAEILLKDAKIRLDFTVYELLYFIREFAVQMENEVNKIIDSTFGKVTWGIAKVVFSGKITADDKKRRLDDITVESFRSTVLQIIEKEENEESGIFKKLAKSAKSTIGKVSMPIVKGVTGRQADKCVKDIITIFANEINSLYSGEHKERKNVHVTSLKEGA